MALCVDISKIFVPFMHFIAFAHYAISMYYDLNYVEWPNYLKEMIFRTGMGGRSRFLTYWCLVSGTINCLLWPNVDDFDRHAMK